MPSMAAIETNSTSFETCVSDWIPPDAIRLMWQEFFSSRNRGVSPEFHFPWIHDRHNLNCVYTFVRDEPAHATVAALILRHNSTASGKKVGLIGLVCVAEHFRGMRLSTRLLKRTVDLARSLQLTHLVLWTTKPDVYKKLGFETDGTDMFGQVTRREIRSSEVERANNATATPIQVMVLNGAPAFAKEVVRYSSANGASISICKSSSTETLVEHTGPIGLIFLFGSRGSGLFVTALVVPLYAKLLNPHDFGIATLVLSGQIFVLAFDLGMATLTARDAAADTDDTTTATQLGRAERLLINLYVVTTPIATGVFVALDWPIWQIVACMCMFLALTLQNLYMNFLLGKSMHEQVAFSQSVGIMVRAVFCAAALMTIHATLEVFILSQLVGSAAHMVLTRWLCTRNRITPSPTTHLPQNRREFSVRSQVDLARRGLPLFVVGMAGAITLNVDKPIVGLFFGAESLAPYFLAATFSLTPIGLLAGPVAQFFQPRIVKAHVDKDSAAISAAIGGFDPRYFMYMEDADICLRLKRAGWRTVLQPACSAIHDARRASHRSLRHLRWHLASAFRFLFLPTRQVARTKYP